MANPAFYEEMATLAHDMIAEYGRDIQLVKTVQSYIDPNRPWLGTTGEEILLPLQGVFVPPNQIRQFMLTALGEGTETQDMMTFSEQIAITHQGENDVRDYRTLRDGGVDWGIVAYQVLRPANRNLLAYIGVRR